MKNTNKDFRITVRFTDKEGKKISRMADKLGVRVSEYIRNVLLDDE